MTPVCTIAERPYTINVLYREVAGKGVIKTMTYTHSELRRAMEVSREELKWEGTVHVTLTDDRTGEEIIDRPGDFYY